VIRAYRRARRVQHSQPTYDDVDHNDEHVRETDHLDPRGIYVEHCRVNADHPGLNVVDHPPIL
jgi:hypothetical protein